jgi:hypothetical protein
MQSHQAAAMGKEESCPTEAGKLNQAMQSKGVMKSLVFAGGSNS